MGLEEMLRYRPFSAAKRETAEKLISASELFRLGAGEKIECGNTIGLVISGEIAVRGLNGGRRVIYRTIPQGDVFGAAQIFGGDGAYTLLTARTECEIAVIPEPAVKEAVESDGAFAFAFAETLCTKLRILNRKLAELSASDATAAVSKSLVTMAERDGMRVGIKSRTEFAASLGMSRMTLYRALETLERNGAVTLAEKDVIINDVDLLKSLI